MYRRYDSLEIKFKSKASLTWFKAGGPTGPGPDWPTGNMVSFGVLSTQIEFINRYSSPRGVLKSIIDKIIKIVCFTFLSYHWIRLWGLYYLAWRENKEDAITKPQITAFIFVDFHENIRNLQQFFASAKSWTFQALIES